MSQEIIPLQNGSYRVMGSANIPRRSWKKHSSVSGSMSCRCHRSACETIFLSSVEIQVFGLHGQRAGRPPVRVPGVRRRGDEEIRRHQEWRPRRRVPDGALREVEASRGEPRRLAGGLPKIVPFSIDFQDIPFMIRPFRRNLRQIERSSIIGVFL